MLHVNEDNNDDLFSNAAGDYFLKADNPDWKGLSGKINHGTPGSPGETPVPGKKKQNHIFHRILHWFNHSLFYRRWFTAWPLKSKKKIKQGLQANGLQYAFCSLTTGV